MIRLSEAQCRICQLTKIKLISSCSALRIASRAINSKNSWLSSFSFVVNYSELTRQGQCSSEYKCDHEVRTIFVELNSLWNLLRHPLVDAATKSFLGPAWTCKNYLMAKLNPRLSWARYFSLIHYIFSCCLAVWLPFRRHHSVSGLLQLRTHRKPKLVVCHVRHLTVGFCKDLYRSFLFDRGTLISLKYGKTENSFSFTTSMKLSSRPKKSPMQMLILISIWYDT